ncbi:hypothetical protein BJ741DRAFT_215511 [Chytriomyces cf. hyalinus JEL632]|nr:hypothetical protein BJ741DRAFT_215511 [Chytriomyces cf. hyalinus JEL632]
MSHVYKIMSAASCFFNLFFVLIGPPNFFSPGPIKKMDVILKSQSTKNKTENRIPSMQYFAILSASLLSLVHAQRSLDIPTTTASTAADVLTPSKECTAARSNFTTVWKNCGLPETTTLVAILSQSSVVKCMCDSYSIVEADVTMCEEYILAKDLAVAKQFLSDLKQRCPAAAALTTAQAAVQTAAQTSAKIVAQTTVQSSAAQSSVKSGGVADKSFASVAMLVAFALVN